MNFNLSVTRRFERELKKLVKKYPSLKKEYAELIAQLHENPTYGTPIGMNCYKIRLSIASKTVGKSGGARVITHIQVSQTTIHLLSIYDKADQATLKDHEIINILKEL